MSDPAVSLDATLKVIEVLASLGAGATVLIMGGRMTGRIESAITTLQADVRKLNEVVSSVAVQGQRLDTHDHRIDLIERLVDDMRRGEGYVLPLPLERAFKAKP